MSTETLRFETETDVVPNGMNVIDRMMRPDHFLEMLSRQASEREDIMIGDVTDLDLKWVADDHSAGFVIQPKSSCVSKNPRLKDFFKTEKQMKLSDTGVRSLAHQVNRSWKQMENFDNPSGRLLSEFHDWYRKERGQGLIVRTTNHGLGEKDRVVDAFVPGDMNTISNFDLMRSVVEATIQKHGDCIRGIQCLNGDSPENLSYRMVFGDPIFKESGNDTRKILFLMLNFMGSEHGLNQTELDLGFWRMVCANGAMRKDLRLVRASWNRFKSESKFLSKVNNLIDMSGIYGESISRLVKEWEETELEESPVEVLVALNEQKLLDKRHYETAMLSVDQVDVDTNWDMLNLLTDAAKTHGDQRRRLGAESRSLALAMQPRSFNGVISEGFSKTLASGDFRKEFKGFDVRDN